ncbi:MAG: ArsB/NhaD family transporter [Chloroflexi bacterium]|nr:ArsB/NhaD family transporter [Chloroflexota bacterium]MCI0646950.1 ArsB/NhaD family transporter [Chloroflexota bacterium]MCI0730016.1 ArsB/NhaD family transporter [Chloroflexota bacterium]
MTAIVVSSFIFLASLAIIFSEKLHRTITAVAGAAAMVIAGLALGFYNEDRAIAAIDFHTLGLLLGMMVLVSLLQPTGFFQYLATLAGQLSGGRPVLLFVFLGTVTTVLSMFLDNVTTVVLIAPVTILISEILGINPIPFLMAEALLSNTGGVGTLVGDPPNVLIGSAANLSFGDFLRNSLPVVVVVWLVVLGLLLYLFRVELRRIPTNAKAIQGLNPKLALDDPVTANKGLVVLGGAVALFFIHHLLHVSPALIALTAAAVALLWIRPDMHQVFERLEWNVLIFFMALFVMVGGLEAAGALEGVAEMVARAGSANPTLLGVGLIWVVAILSAVVDNIPITIALIPVIEGLGAAGIDAGPLWWALVFGAGFGGNGTIIGSTANVVVVSLSERTRRPITAVMWARHGLPVMVVACLVSSVMYVLLMNWLQ